MSRPTLPTKALPLAIAIAILPFTSALADDAVEDTWWQAAGRDRTAYLDAGVEVTVDDGNVEGEVGEAGNIELTTGFWWVPFAAAEVQVAVGQAVNPGVLSDTRVSSTHGSIGAGLRLGMPIRLSPVLAAHVGYRQVLSERAVLTCGADCANRNPVAMDHAPDQQIYGDAEAGLQLNIGSFSMTATVEYCRPLSRTDTTEATMRGNPDAATADLGDPAAGREVGFNLQAGVRF